MATKEMTEKCLFTYGGLMLMPDEEIINGNGYG